MPELPTFPINELFDSPMGHVMGPILVGIAAILFLRNMFSDMLLSRNQRPPSLD